MAMRTQASAARAKRRRPLRANASEARLLDAAEALFARHGYNGVSIRDIAGAARANISSVYYHFGSKQDLLAAVCRRRMLPVVAERAAAMAAADGRHVAPLAQIVSAFVGPTLRAAQSRGREAALFRRLAGHLATDPTPGVRRAIRSIFDTSVRAFVDGLRANHAGDAEAFFWAVACSMGVAVYVQSDLAHIARLLGRTYAPADVERGLQHVTRFIEGGLDSALRRSA